MAHNRTHATPRPPSARPARHKAALAPPHRSKASQSKASQRRNRRRRAQRRRWGWLLAVVAALAFAAMLLVTSRDGARQGSSQQVGAPAPGFTLTDTGGRRVSLGDYRGRDVVLYFSEGVGCEGCWYQMAELEKHQGDLDKLGLTVLPVVVNDPAAVRAEMRRFGLRTPFWSTVAAPSAAATAPPATAPPCTPTCPATPSFWSTRPAASPGRASTRRCTCPPASCSPSSARRSVKQTGVPLPVSPVVLR
jgi:hypothetical protein